MFSKGSLRAQRFLVATQSVTPDKVEHVSRQLWMRVWSRVCNIILLEGAKFTSLRVLSTLVAREWKSTTMLTSQFIMASSSRIQ